MKSKLRISEFSFLHVFLIMHYQETDAPYLVMYLLIFRKADYEAFQKGRLVNPDASRSANGAVPITSYFQSTTKYKHSDPEQKAIRKAILDLVVE